MTPTLVLEIPDALWMTSNQREHRMVVARKTREVRRLAELAARAANLPRFMQVHVGVFVGYPTRRRADPANAYPTLKAALDGLTDAGVWEDDDSAHVVAVTFMREATKSPANTHSLRLVLTDQALPF